MFIFNLIELFVVYLFYIHHIVIHFVFLCLFVYTTHVHQNIFKFNLILNALTK